LADDLGRFIKLEPIHARRSSAPERVAKWSRRHRNWVAAIVVVLLLSVIGLSASTLLITQERNAFRTAANEANTQGTRAAGNLLQARAAVGQRSASTFSRESPPSLRSSRDAKRINNHHHRLAAAQKTIQLAGRPMALAA